MLPCFILLSDRVKNQQNVSVVPSRNQGILPYVVRGHFQPHMYHWRHSFWIQNNAVYRLRKSENVSSLQDKWTVCAMRQAACLSLLLSCSLKFVNAPARSCLVNVWRLQPLFRLTEHRALWIRIKSLVYSAGYYALCSGFGARTLRGMYSLHLQRRLSVMKYADGHWLYRVYESSCAQGLIISET